MNAIHFKGIKKSFGKTKILDGLDLELKKGEILGLIGRSGCGKSTLLKVLTGFYDMDAGKIYHHDKDISNKKSAIMNAIGFCTQDNSYYHELTAKENLTYYGRMYGMGGKELRQRMDELLQLVELKGHEKRVASSLSGGMKRRVDLAISLVHDPDILILDEPTTGLDPILRESIFELIKKINDRGKTIIIISHHLEYLQKYCTKVAVIEKGKRIAEFDPKKIPKKYSKHNSLREAFKYLMRERGVKDK